MRSTAHPREGIFASNNNKNDWNEQWTYVSLKAAHRGHRFPLKPSWLEPVLERRPGSTTHGTIRPKDKVRLRMYNKDPCWSVTKSHGFKSEKFVFQTESKGRKKLLDSTILLTVASIVALASAGRLWGVSCARELASSPTQHVLGLSIDRIGLHRIRLSNSQFERTS